MATQQRFVRIHDRAIVWAENLEDAERRYPHDVRAMPNYYLVGHGYSLKQTGALPPGYPQPCPRGLGIPQGLFLKFYCVEGGRFDSTWEPHIVDAGRANGPFFSPDEFKQETLSSVGSPVAEHVLAYPSVKLSVSIRAMIQMRTQNDNSHVQIQSQVLPDGARLYIGRAKIQPRDPNQNPLAENWAYLSGILAALKPHGPAYVHWLSCRDFLTADTTDDFLDRL
jgi:hypothetical protein